VIGGSEKRRQQADGIQYLERPRLNRSGARLAVWPRVALDEPCVHAVAGKLGGGEQPGRPGADDQDIVSRHSIPGQAQSWVCRPADPGCLLEPHSCADMLGLLVQFGALPAPG
jgi:hypothetical protein